MEEEEPTVIEIRQGEQSTEIIAEQIERIADAADALLDTGLTERALILLIQDKIGATNIGKRQIQDVLDALPRLREFLR